MMRMQSENKVKYYFLVFGIFLLLSSNVQAACSEDYVGLATINEIYEKSNDWFVEVKLLSKSIPAAVYNDWEVVLCRSFWSFPLCQTLSLNNAVRQKSWLVLPKSEINPFYLDLNGGMDVLLRDKQGNTIDYLSVEGQTTNQDTSCTPRFDWQHSDNINNTNNIFRQPDGIGNWITFPGNSGSETGGTDNSQNPVPGPDIFVSNDAVFQGDNLEFVVSLSASSSTTVTVDFTTINHTAIAGTDYVAQSGVLSFLPGVTSLFVTVPTMMTSKNSASEMALVLDNQSSGLITGQIATGKIYPHATLEWRFEEGPWSGAPGEILDESANGLNGVALNSAVSSDINGAISSNPGTCAYAKLNGINQYIEINDNNLLDLSSELTVSAWINTSTIPIGSNLKSIVSKDTNYEFHLNSNREIYWWWRNSSGIATSFTTVGANIQAGIWYHIAMTYKDGEQKIYVNGIERGSATYSGSLRLNNNPFQVGQDQGITSRYFSGGIDEVRVYASSLPSSLIQTIYQDTHPCSVNSCTLGGFQITQPSVALACPLARAEISFQAMCADGTTPKTDYAGTIGLSSNENSLSQFFTASSGGSAINSISLTGTENGAGTVYLYHQNENDNVRITLTDAAASVISSATQGTDFRSSGFTVTSPTGFSCGTTQNLTITAIGQQDNLSGACSVLTGFSGLKAISAWARVNYDVDESPPVADALASPFILNGTSISASSQTTANLDLDFSAGQASVSLQHLNAAQVLGLEFAHDDGQAGTPELRGSSTAMIIAPDRIQVNAPSPASSCPGNDHNCTPFVSAGSDFNLNVAAVCADAAVTVATSYHTPAAQSIALNLNLIAPPAPNGVNGMLGVTQVPIPVGNNGQTTLTNQSISEVGVFTVDATAPAYFGRAIAQGTSDSIGRFFPHHFDLSLSTANFASSCNNFSYLDQDFYFNTAPLLRIEAKNADGVTTTKNYEGAFWKLGASLQEQGMCNGISSIKGFCYSDNVGGAASLWAPNGSQSYGNINDINGVLEMSLHALDAFRYQRPAIGNVMPFDADIQLTVELDDGDATGSQSLANIGFVGDSDSGSTNYNLTNDRLLRHGRWNMENAFGPETENLAIKAHVQYYSFANRFVFNPDDNCTVFTNADITLAPSGSGATNFDAIPVGASGTSNFSVNSPLVLGEDENFSLSFPGAGNVGDIDIFVDLSSQPWLRYDWDGNGSMDDHPSVEAAFGQYRGHDRIIYWREVSN